MGHLLLAWDKQHHDSPQDRIPLSFRIGTVIVRGTDRGVGCYHWGLMVCFWFPLLVLYQFDHPFRTINTVFDKDIPRFGVGKPQVVHCVHALECLLSKGGIKKFSPVMLALVLGHPGFQQAVRDSPRPTSPPLVQYHPDIQFWSSDRAV